jgi:hypothetical protein
VVPVKMVGSGKIAVALLFLVASAESPRPRHLFASSALAFLCSTLKRDDSPWVLIKQKSRATDPC